MGSARWMAIWTCGAMAIGGTALSGCGMSRNGHSRMSAAQIEARVEEEFPIGTPQDAVMTRLRREGARYEPPLPMEEPVGWSTLRVHMDQPWWGPLEWAGTYTKTQAWADLLFDSENVLREVKGEARERTW